MGNNQSTVIEGYKIGSELGAGAFGKVYYATKDGKSYAIKRIDIGRRDNAERIMKEVDSHRRLSHVNVIKYYDYCYTNDAVWIVMKYCNGGNLNCFLLKKSPSYSQLLDFTQQVCRGIDYLHSQEVIHRDIKPDNIMIYSGFLAYTLKIADFGLSRIWENFDYQSPYYDFSYDPRGPPYYSAPEIVNGNVTMKSDIFSLGCMVLAIFSRTTIPWIGGKPLLAPYIGSPRLQIADATENQKRSYIQEFVKLPCGGDEGLLQELVVSMVQENWRDRPNARSVLSRANNVVAGCTIL